MLEMNEKIQALRHRHNLSQAKMAEKIGVNRLTYRASEMGKRPWRFDELEQIAEIFGVTVKDLIDDPDTLQ